MLILPITGKSAWSNPPYLTILLILANCLVFFAFQADEAKQLQKVTAYYSFSGLAKIEAPYYAKYLQQQGKAKELKEFRANAERYGAEAIYWAITGNKGFGKRLNNDEIVTREQEVYRTWKEKRTQLAELTSAVFMFKYGHRPDRFVWYSPLTYMVLHGGAMHLFGNMVFLWLVGSILEIKCQRAAYLLGYLATGYFSAVLFGLIYRDSSVPLVGASGAIAGLMGAVTVIYGLGRIKVFYSLGFVFGYLKIRALWLLPLWVGKELFQLFLGGPSNVAYVGHMGGLLSGAALGFLHLKLVGAAAEETSAEEEAQHTALLMEKGMTLLANLDFTEARPLFVKILEADPRNLKALIQLYKIDKRHPENPEFQKSAGRLLNLLCRRREDAGQLVDTYREYHRLGGAGLSRELYAALGMSLAANGDLDEAAQVATHLLKAHPTFPGVPGCLLALAKAFGRHGQAGKGATCLKIICSKYPESPEFRVASELLRG